MSTEEKTPSWVICTKCSHEWIGFYTPGPLGEFAKLLRDMHCPNCFTGSKDIRLQLKGGNS